MSPVNIEAGIQRSSRRRSLESGRPLDIQSVMKPSLRPVLVCALMAAFAASPRAASAQQDPAFEPPPPPPDEDVDLNAPPPPSAQPPPRAPDQRTFEQQLSPYGRWVDTPEYGRVWMPANVGPDWQPYADGQ